MTFDQIISLTGGTVFVIVGVLVSMYYKWKKFLPYIFIIIGFFQVYISIFGSLSESKSKIDEIITIDSTKVKYIIFQPTRFRGYEKLSMFEKDSIILSRKTINEICKKLHEAKEETSPKMRHVKEACRVEIDFINNKKLILGIRKTEETTYIMLDSDGEYGWHYATLDAKEFGNLVASFSSSVGTPKQP